MAAFQESRIPFFLEIIETSSVLQSALPEVRMLALCETVRYAQSEEMAKEIILENLATSPYIPNERKDPIAELIFTDQWDSIRTTLQCNRPSSTSSPETTLTPFLNYRAMVVSIFSRSRKIAAIDEDRRRQLGGAIHVISSVDGLKSLAMGSLETSQAFDEDARNLVANDLIDDRYDLLLLPNRFDCEELPRAIGGRGSHRMGRGNNVVLHDSQTDDDEYENLEAVGEGDSDNPYNEECPVCLGTNPSDTKLPCNHLLCLPCTTAWAAQHGNDIFPCPLCNAETRLYQTKTYGALGEWSISPSCPP